LSLDPSGLAFVFTAGIFALFSPCGFPMLPGYISYYIGTKASLEKAVPEGAACALGLIAVFSAIGIIASMLGSFVSRYIPLFELVAGPAAVFMGVAMMMKIRLPVFWAGIRAPKRRGPIGIFLYGAVYGLATMGCSAPLFFSVLFYAIATGGYLQGIVTFTVYAAGMGLPLIITTVLVAKAKELMLERIIEATPLLQRISGIVLAVIGVYLICFYYAALYVV